MALGQAPSEGSMGLDVQGDFLPPGRWLGLGTQQGLLAGPHLLLTAWRPHSQKSLGVSIRRPCRSREASKAPAAKPRASLLPCGLGQHRPREDEQG